MKKCLSYIEGKEKLRSHEFGQKRFDAVLAFMSEIMDEGDFNKEIDRINTIRKVEQGNKKYIDKNDYKHHVFAGEDN